MISQLIVSEAAADVNDSFILLLCNKNNHMAQCWTGPRRIDMNHNTYRGIVIATALCYEAVRDALALAKCPSAGRVSDGKRLWLRSRDAPDSQSESRPHIPSKDNSNLAPPVFQRRAEPCHFFCCPIFHNNTFLQG